MKAPSADLSRSENPLKPKIYTGLVVCFIGLFVFVVGAKPNWLGWDRSPAVGFVQIAVFLLGLGVICLGGCIGLFALWFGRRRTIAADIGVRLVSTGYVIAVFGGMADVFGLGSQPLPAVPYFGPWQASAVLLGQAIIALGFLLLVPYRNPRMI
jgi:xanthine/uracil permease